MANLGADAFVFPFVFNEDETPVQETREQAEVLRSQASDSERMKLRPANLRFSPKRFKDGPLRTVAKKITKEQKLVPVERLSLNMDNPDEDIKPNKDSNRFVCTLCGLTYQSLAGLRAHDNIHTGRFKCDICGHNFHHNTALKKHRETHSRPTIECTVCGKILANLRGLHCHMLSHKRSKTGQNSTSPLTLERSGNGGPDGMSLFGSSNAESQNYMRDLLAPSLPPLPPAISPVRLFPASVPAPNENNFIVLPELGRIAPEIRVIGNSIRIEVDRRSIYGDQTAELAAVKAELAESKRTIAILKERLEMTVAGIGAIEHTSQQIQMKLDEMEHARKEFRKKYPGPNLTSNPT